ncbi:MAG: hypothetical protein LBQ52_10585 [Helicobacteraceae bacterium]|jgi:hypothetical protein|nr:hypothetical protein [Helicobacteraceae bacterium]
MNQGTKSNVSGSQLEEAVKTVLIAKGFELVGYSQWVKNPKNYSDELLLKNVPFKSIYGHIGKTEFLLISKRRDMKIRIECKWQQTSGSVDEKLPYLYLNVIEAMPEQTIMILIDGKGWRDGAIKWLENAAAKRKYVAEQNAKEIMIFKIVDFFAWANKTFND